MSTRGASRRRRNRLQPNQRHNQRHNLQHNLQHSLQRNRPIPDGSGMQPVTSGFQTSQVARHSSERAVRTFIANR